MQFRNTKMATVKMLGARLHNCLHKSVGDVMVIMSTFYTLCGCDIWDYGQMQRLVVLFFGLGYFSYEKPG